MTLRWTRDTLPRPDTVHLCANPHCRKPLNVRGWKSYTVAGVRRMRVVWSACECDGR